MSIDYKNAHVKAVKTAAAQIAAIGDKLDNELRGPWFTVCEGVALAVHDEKKGKKSGLAKREDYTALLTECGLPTTGPRVSERWSIGQLGLLECAPALFENLRKIKPTVTITALYDVSNCIRAKGPWADKDDNDSPLKGKAMGGKDGWKKDAKNAPSLEQLQAAIKAGSAERNRKSKRQAELDAEPLTLEDLQTSDREYLKNVAKKLQAMNNDRKATKVRPFEVKGYSSVHLLTAINAVNAFLAGDVVAAKRPTRGMSKADEAKLKASVGTSKRGRKAA
jgi:hypothetical protein